MNFLRSWKTTLAGIATILSAVAVVVNDPKKLSDMDTIGMFIAGVGLLAAKDGNVSGKATATLDKKVEN